MQHPLAVTHRLPPKALFLLLCLALGWGINWPVMKVVLTELEPLTFRGLSLIAGGLGVLAIARAAGTSLVIQRQYYSQVFWLTVLNMIGWNVFAIYGLDYLPAGRAALLAYTMPVWCVPLSVWLLNEALTPRRILAVLLGLGGIAALMSQNLGELLHAPVGAVLMLAAAWCWAGGIVLLKYWQLPINTVVLTGWLLLVGGVPITMAAYFLEGMPTHWPSFWPAFGFVYNTVIGFMFCYWAWNRLVLLVPVSVSSLSSLITPIIGVVAGAVLLNERPGWREALAAALILSAVAVISIVRKTSPVRHQPNKH